MEEKKREEAGENDEKKKVITRLKRIEGHVRGIQKMIEEDCYCVDVIIQINAINAARKQVGFSLLEDHANHCVIHALESGDGEASVQELINVVKQLSK